MSTICTLEITFHGICTHFSNVVPGVPHRVVLVNAKAVRLGLFNLPSANPEGTDFNYCLLPHFPFVYGYDGQVLSAGTLIERSFIRTPVRLQLTNAVDTKVTYDPSYWEVPSLITAVPDYRLSGDVVNDGRAACYLDFMGGHFSATPPDPGPVHVKAEVSTNGPPAFLVTPLEPVTAGGVAPPAMLTLASPDGVAYAMTVSSLEPADVRVSGYDFLLHYLTAAGGIPRALAGTLPGMDVLKEISASDLATRLRELATSAGNGWPDFPAASRPHSGHDSPSCVDARYP